MTHLIASCCIGLSIEKVSALVGIITPAVLLYWFYHSQKQIHSKSYYSEIGGIYAAFTQPRILAQPNERVSAGLIMNIRSTDDSGYFIGEFDYSEVVMSVVRGEPSRKMLRDGFSSFLGKLDYSLPINELFSTNVRHPFKLEENRVYSGKLFVLDRLDFSLENFNVEKYIIAEYDVTHYREMRILKFTLNSIKKTTGSDLPNTFILYKSFGFSFEPYKSVKSLIFNNRKGVDD